VTAPQEHDDITDREVIGYIVDIVVDQIPEVRRAVWERRLKDLLLQLEHHIECVETDIARLERGEELVIRGQY
jgi:hypothetical protein